MRIRTVIAASCAALLLSGVVCGCAPSTAPLSGRVVDDSVSLQVPALPASTPDPDAGFSAGLGGAAAGGARRARATTTAAITGIGSVSRIASVAVDEGESVSVGQLVAILDSVALDADVVVARANQREARAQIGVIDANLADLADARATIADGRAKLDSNEAQLRATHAKLVTQLAQVDAILAKLAAGPPSIPPSGPPMPPPGPMPDPAALKGAAAQLRAGIAQIDAGLAKLAAGRTKLSSASAKASDAKVLLQDLRKVVVVAAGASSVGVDVARYRRSLAEIRSPFDGVVLSTARVGDQLSPGATVATIRRAGPVRVTTWVTPEQAAGLRLGGVARTQTDTFEGGGAQERGRITRIGVRAEYPPTSLATQEIHMTRAVPIEITLDQGLLGYNPGLPVDVYLR